MGWKSRDPSRGGGIAIQNPASHRRPALGRAYGLTPATNYFPPAGAFERPPPDGLPVELLWFFAK
jgi:hypothetical protein